RSYCMTRHIHTFIITLALAVISAIPAMSQTSLKVSLDSAYLLMGKATPLHIELIAPASADGALVIPADTMSDKVEILRILPADTTDISNGRVQINQELTLQSFDSGTYILNPILYVQGGETIASNRPVLKVLPAMVDSLVTIHDYADVADVDRRLVDYLPDFLADYGLWILAVIVVLLLGYYTWRRITSGKSEVKAVKVVIPPYELAMRELESLRSYKLCEQGRNFCNKIWNAFRLVKGWDVDHSLAQPQSAALACRWFESKLSQSVAEINDLLSKYRLSEALKEVYRLFWDEFSSWYLEMVKPAYGSPIDAATLNSTLGFFDALMRLLHPFMPFITEELWQHIAQRREGESIMYAPTPEVRTVDHDMLAMMEHVKEVVNGLRNVRAAKNIPNKDAIAVNV
ncbi:MAG: class I tRNA ligase family protein, partial [Paramuribaculum sp.]|nr:class I tRNA ligase family protein [Paramuribaculum sp.]